MLASLKRWLRNLRKQRYRSKVIRVAESCGRDPKVNFLTVVNNKTRLGNNFNSNGLTVVGKGRVVIGDNFHCGFGCVLITENHNHHGNAIPYDNTYVLKDTHIGDNVWLGINVILQNPFRNVMLLIICSLKLKANSIERQLNIHARSLIGY